MICVVDTSVLITFYEIDKITLLNQLFNEVYIPITVEEQFLKVNSDQKLQFLLPLYDANEWLKKCQTYQDDTLKILSTDNRIDEGEREAIAQYQKIKDDLAIESGRIFCAIDEKDARKVAISMDIDVRGSLYLVARLHHLGFLDYYGTVEPIAKKRRFSKRLIAEAFESAKSGRAL